MNEARVAAARVLVALERQRTTLAAELERCRPSTTDSRDQALYQELVLGTTRRRSQLDARLRPHLRRPIGSLQPELRAILRVAAYQHDHLTRVPPHAIVNESVEAARSLGHPRAVGFVNAVLRNMMRAGKKNSPQKMDPASIAELAEAHSHPEWLLRRWVERAGVDASIRWCEFNNVGGATTVRPVGGEAARLIAALREQGIEAEPARFVIDAIHLEPGALGRVPPSLRDELIVQDEGAQLVALACDVRENDRVLDVCAAPGGKATLLARLAGEGGFVVAGDNRSARVALLRETVLRSRTRAAVLALDAEGPLPFRDTFDRVLLDVPCSGLGVVRRDPDIKWSRSEASLATFAASQRRMVKHAADVVAPGGALLYATCSSEPDENEDVVHHFLRVRPDFRIDPIRFPAGKVASADSLVDDDGFLRTRPDRHRLDAYFAARLVRQNPA